MSNALVITQDMLDMDPTSAAAPALPSNVEIDLGNLMAYTNLDLPVKRAKDNAYLLSIASEHTQHLMNQLCQLPSEASAEFGRLIVLPTPDTRVPREKPIPKEKPMTRWEKFAQQKGLKKRKRDKLIYDDEHDEWRERFGKNRANDKGTQWAIEESEVKSKFKKDNPNADPWTLLDMEKKANVGKNKKQQEKNLQFADVTQRKGSAPVMDLSTAIGKHRPGKRNAQHKEAKDKSHVDIALQIAQKSTNSMGKFDKLRKGEDRVKHKTRSEMGKLNKYSAEQSQHQKVMKKVLGKVTEQEALKLQKAMHAVGATSVAKGEVTTLAGIKSRNKLKDKMHKATTAKKNSRVNARKAGKSGGGGSGSKSSKGGKKGGRK